MEEQKEEEQPLLSLECNESISVKPITLEFWSIIVLELVGAAQKAKPLDIWTEA